MTGSSLRLTMANFGCIARQTRAFTSPLRNYLPRRIVQTEFQTPANSLLCNARTLHTSVITNTDKSPKEVTAHEQSGTQATLKDRMKIVVQEYGTTAIVFHVTISLTSLGICYAAVKRLVQCSYRILTFSPGRGVLPHSRYMYGYSPNRVVFLGLSI